MTGVIQGRQEIIAYCVCNYAHSMCMQSGYCMTIYISVKGL